MRARMKVTVMAPHGDSHAFKGKVYPVVSVENGQVTLRIPAKRKVVPEEFVVDLKDVEMLKDLG